MRSEFLRVFAAERERIGRVDAARDHAHERFIFFRFGSRHLLKLEHFRRTIFVRDHRPHHWFFVSARCADGQDSERG